MPTTQAGMNPAAEETRALFSPGATVARPNDESAAFDEMLPGVYEELRRLAAAYLRGEMAEQTLQGMALVHEAYLRLRKQGHMAWENPAHVIGMFARVMRETLINRAVSKHRLKRGGTGRIRRSVF